MLRNTRFIWLLAGALALPAWAAQGVMIRDDSLRAGASSGSPEAGRLLKGAKVDILARQGGWTQVRAAGKSGWVRLLSVRTSAPADNGAGDLDGVVALTQKRDPGKVVAVAGLRGLNEEELRSAQFNAQEMQRLENQATSAAEARRFAAEGGLTARAVAHLPAPKSQESGTATWGSNGL